MKFNLNSALLIIIILSIGLIKVQDHKGKSELIQQIAQLEKEKAALIDGARTDGEIAQQVSERIIYLFDELNKTKIELDVTKFEKDVEIYTEISAIEARINLVDNLLKMIDMENNFPILEDFGTEDKIDIIKSYLMLTLKDNEARYNELQAL